MTLSPKATARWRGPPMTRTLGLSVVDNRMGAGGNVATHFSSACNVALKDPSGVAKLNELGSVIAPDDKPTLAKLLRFAFTALRPISSLELSCHPPHTQPLQRPTFP